VLAAGCALLLASNLLVLGRAAWNRSGESACELTLTERELELPVEVAGDDSGLALSLRLTTDTPRFAWKASPNLRRELPSPELPWLDRDRLAAIGFDLRMGAADPDAGNHYEDAGARRAFLALEMEGDGWRRWIAGREEQVAALRAKVETGGAGAEELREAEALLALDRTMRSRLFPVDAGMDATALRQRHPDRRSHAIVEGRIVVRVLTPEGGEPALCGRVLGPLVSEIHVPPELRARIAALSSADRAERATHRESEHWPEPTPPRYRGLLAYGRLNDPWLLDLTSPG
jgi:hypothetical protein